MPGNGNTLINRAERVETDLDRPATIPSQQARVSCPTPP
jgi:hypothetical protein